MTSHSLSCTSYLYTATPPTAIVVATPAILTSQLLVISCRSPPVDFCSALSICQLSISPMERRDRRDSAYYDRRTISAFTPLTLMSDLVVASLPLSHSLYLSLSVSFCLCFCFLSSSLSLALWYVFWEPRSCFSVSLYLSPPPLARLTKNSTVRIKKKNWLAHTSRSCRNLRPCLELHAELSARSFCPLAPPIYRILSILPSLSLSRFFDTRPSIQVSCDWCST